MKGQNVGESGCGQKYVDLKTLTSALEARLISKEIHLSFKWVFLSHSLQK